MTRRSKDSSILHEEIGIRDLFDSVTEEVGDQPSSTTTARTLAQTAGRSVPVAVRSKVAAWHAPSLNIRSLTSQVRDRRSRRRRLDDHIILLLWAGICLILLLLVNILHQPALFGAERQAAPAPTASSEEVASAPATTGPAIATGESLEPPAPPAVVEPVAPFRPANVSVPNLGIVAPVSPVGTRSDGQMEIPEDPSVVGWWEGGSMIGDEVGHTVLAGHVFNKEWGPGIFSKLEGAHVGDTVEVSSPDGVVSDYVVNDVVRVPKDEFPIGRVFGQDGPHQVVLATCGNYNPSTQHYEDNILVFAAPAA